MYRARSLLLFVAFLCFSSFSTLAAANPWALTPGASVSNTIASNDSHYYRINLTQAGTLALYTTGNSDTIGWLYDVSNGVMAGVFVASDDDSGEGLNFRMSGALPAGDYLLEVSTYGNVSGAYTLRSEFSASGSSGSGGSSGSSMPTPWQQSGVRFDRTPTGASTSVRFGIGLTRDGSNYVTTASTTDNLQVLGYIQPEPQHVGRKADIFIVDRINMNFMMRDVDGNYSNWSSNVPDLVPAVENVTLQSLTTVTVHSGRIGVSGDHRLFLGYMVDGQLYYTLTPLQLNITVGSSGDGTGNGSGSSRPKLTTGTSGSGQGTVSPSGGEYNVGEVVTVRANPHRYSYFHSWTGLSDGCPGLTGGCRITMDEDFYMQARFEPITWTVPLGDFSYQIFLEDGSNQCTWNVRWTNTRADFTWRQQSNGSYQGSVTLTGHRSSTSSQNGCNGSDENISRTTNIDASGDNFAVRFLARSGVGSEYITLNAFGALSETSVPVTGFIEYTGTNRRGRYDFGINSIAPRR